MKPIAAHLLIWMLEMEEPLRRPVIRGNSTSSTSRTKRRHEETRSTPMCKAMGQNMLESIPLPMLQREWVLMLIKYILLLTNSTTNSLGVLYPRGATLGGSSQVNAMNFIWAPDNEWDHIANLTGDESWSHEHMRRHLMDLENCTYTPAGTHGHGHDGYLEVNSIGHSSRPRKMFTNMVS